MTNSKRILIIDDEPDFVEAFQRTLEARSYQVMTTSSKTLAQEMMSAGPDIVVLGPLAPAGQAFSLHQWLLRHPRHRDIPRIVIDARYEERATGGESSRASSWRPTNTSPSQSSRLRWCPESRPCWKRPPG